MTRTPTVSTYDEDFYAWTQEQAAALRRLPAADDVDIAHVAEEIEDLGKRDLREVTSFLSRLFEHLIKIDNMPKSRDRAHWCSEAVHFQLSAVAAFSPSMRGLIDLSRAWRLGCKRARAGLTQIGKPMEALSESPFQVDELMTEDFDLDSALVKLAATRASESHP